MSKRRGGRPRKPGRREGSGKLSRRKAAIVERSEMTEREAKAVVIDARARHTGLPAELVDSFDAGRPNAGTVHGTMRLRGIVAERAGKSATAPGMLTADEWSAAEWWIGRRQGWLRAIDAPGRQTGERREEAAASDPDAYAEWARETMREWGEIEDCLVEAGVEARSPVKAAFDVMLVRGQYLPHMERDLRIGLRAIHSLFLAGRRKAA